MTKYIDADALEYGPDSFKTIYEVKRYIDKQPSANVAEVVYGEWCKHGLGTHQYFCSVCGGKESAPRPHCPRCGARMDGEKEGQ